jgi:hypothetical protein
MRKEPLFNKRELSEVLDNQPRLIQQDVDGFPPEQVLHNHIDDLTKLLVEKYEIEPIALHLDGIHVDSHGETKIDKTYDPLYGGVRYGQDAIMVDGLYTEWAIPFSGDYSLFSYAPSQFLHHPLYPSRVGSELRFRFERVTKEAEEMKKDFESAKHALITNVSAINAQVDTYNAKLPSLIRPKFQARKEKLLKAQGIVEAFGYPIRPKSGASMTYPAEVKRKKIFQLPRTSGEPYKPEPRLEMEMYEDILNFIWNMAMMFERSPSQFIKVKEEGLRMHILLHLNGAYEGKATGETFNGDGRTDILLRDNGKNIFIGECKFWGGAKVFRETIDQLLGYTTWRDAKTAIILFNRSKTLSTSNILKQIPEIAEKHPHFRNNDSANQPLGRLRFTFTQKNDPSRHILMTVLVFDVPVE